MPNDALPLPALNAFEAAARHGSFTRAAAELGLTQAAVSYHINRLEQRLGTPLFIRRGRSLALTEAGERLAVEVVDAFGRLRAAVGGETGAAAHALAVASVPTFATHWLAPRLGAFQAAHPDIAIKLATSTELGDRTDDRLTADVEIRSGPGGFPPALAAHRLLEVRLACVVAPRLAAGLRRPADVLSLPLIGMTMSWDAWFDAVGVRAPESMRKPAPRFDSQVASAQAAATGMGAALVTPDFFTEDLAAGRLVAPFPVVVDRGKGYWLVHAADQRHRPKIRAFRDWILAAARP
ncbi:MULTISPECIES: LysR substrate-binding domain-containing protein [Inquilinus]|uniref:LysR family glycine cleavage system transcriptional activator n=1 Tax=Inquilinus ginsengisoli TaxID=363840 RepID=A0ABU1JHQ3_9PROT|nr:LysR substrate-binding domain-containing protein [Inquilinus ginsengisoli]MDR6287579.1 LysR family glycine cleavage system transcriptional activator [Inquilinus ginsengisoli]